MNGSSSSVSPALLDVCFFLSIEMEQPIQDYPGYFYNWIGPLQQWGMRWQPLKGEYSPPQLDASIQWIHLALPEGVNMIPLLGDGVMHCAHLAPQIGATYLYYRQDLGKMEIWAHDVVGAMTKLSIYLQTIKEKQNKNKTLLPPQ